MIIATSRLDVAQSSGVLDSVKPWLFGLRWRKPRAIFVNSMSDLFHKNVPTEFIQHVFGIMRRAHWHRFQILTKRSDRLLQLSDQLDWAPNIWMGVTIENAQFLHTDFPHIGSAIRVN